MLTSRTLGASELPEKENYPYAKKNWCIDDFDIGFKLGKGRFGNVYLVRVKGLDYVVALKVRVHFPHCKIGRAHV